MLYISEEGIVIKIMEVKKNLILLLDQFTEIHILPQLLQMFFFLTGNFNVFYYQRTYKLLKVFISLISFVPMCSLLYMSLRKEFRIKRETVRGFSRKKISAYTFICLLDLLDIETSRCSIPYYILLFMTSTSVYMRGVCSGQLVALWSKKSTGENLMT